MDGPSTSWADLPHEALAVSPVVHCFVPQCPSASSKFPNKLFLAVPKDPKVRADWLEAAGKLYVVSGSHHQDMHCCEDHFDMEKDIADWPKCRQLGGPVHLKQGVVPHIFECQQRATVARKQKRAPLKRSAKERKLKRGGRNKKHDEPKPSCFISEALQTEDYCIQTTPFRCDGIKGNIRADKVRSETICLVPGVTDSYVFDAKVKSEEVDPMQADVVCKTCLAADRRLYSLQNSPQYWDVCRGVDLSGCDAVCFECRARLAGFARFRRRAARASRALAAVLRDASGWTQIPPGPCLSTLTLKTISPTDTIEVDGDAVQPQVKQETPDDFILTVEPLKTEGLKAMEQVDSPESIPDAGADQDGGQQDGDDSETETASETGEGPPRELFNEDFVATNLNRDEVLSHMERERNSARYQRARHKCAPCALVFYSVRHLRTHNMLHDKKRGPAECDICHQRFKTKHYLKFHAPTHYTRFECRRCDHVEYSYKKMYGHYRDVHDDTPRVCSLCSQTYTKYAELRKHMRAAHRTEHACAHCGRSFTNKIILQRHVLMSHTKVPDMECQYCHKKYKGEFNLKVHIQDAHENTKRPDENAYCAECDVQFSTIHRYRRHLRHATRHATDLDLRFECDYCGRRCREKAALRTHIELMHIKIARYKCDECEQSFPTAAYMKRHKRLKHLAAPRTKRHVCHLCEKAFTVRKSLDEHMNTHLGVRPFVCKYCDATFSYSAALYNHNQLVHLKAKLGKKRNG